MVCWSRPISAALRSTVIGTVKIQALKMPLKRRQSTACLERTKPTAQTEPTRQWVVLIGMPRLEAIRTVIAAPILIARPLYKEIGKSVKLDTDCLF